MTNQSVANTFYLRSEGYRGGTPTKGNFVHQLVYISTARRGLTDADIGAILATSRRNNRRDSITGLLVHDDKRFLQALEGYGPLVEAAFSRIKSDVRHRAAVMLSYREVGERQFGDWDMACQRVQTPNQRGALVDTVDALVAQVSDPNIRAQFSSFARIERRAE